MEIAVDLGRGVYRDRNRDVSVGRRSGLEFVGGGDAPDRLCRGVRADEGLSGERSVLRDDSIGCAYGGACRHRGLKGQSGRPRNPATTVATYA